MGEFRALPPVVDDAGGGAESTAEKGGPAGEARGVGGVKVLEDEALGGELVDVGGGWAVVAVTSEVFWPERVDVDVEDAHGLMLAVG